MSAVETEPLTGWALVDKWFENLGSSWTKDPPPGIVALITNKMPKLVGQSKKIKDVFANFVKYAIAGFSDENLAFLIEIQQVRDLSAKGKKSVGPELRAIWNKYIKEITKEGRVTDKAPRQVNLSGQKDSKTAEFKTVLKGAAGSNPTDPLWNNAVGQIVTVVSKDIWGRFEADNEALLQKIAQSKWDKTKDWAVNTAHAIKTGVSDVFKSDDAHVQGYNELFRDDYELGYFREPRRGYTERDYSVSRGGFIDHGTGAVYGHNYIDPNIFVVLLCIFAVVCCVCVAFTSVISCVIGYFAHLFKDECVSVKRRIEEDEEV